jgi:hypothetical protein
MKLTPPPRLDETRPAPPPGDRPRRLAALATLLGFGGLVAAGIAAFVLLPGWVEVRRRVAEERPGPATANAPAPPEAASSEPGGSRSGSPEATPILIESAPTTGLPAEAPPISPPPSENAASGPSTFTPAPSAPAPAPVAEDGLAAEITTGLAALDRRDFVAARDAFRRARALDPGSAAAADGLARAEQGLRLAALLDMRAQAAAEEAREAWREALRLYDEALKLEPSVEFALEGRPRAVRRAELDDRLEGYLGRPERLSSSEVHAEATVYLTMAAEIDSAGPRLTAQRDRLEELLAVYSVSVTLTLVSDAETEVLVYGVGRLGAFERRELELRPGVYTLVGSRDGFRDVRRELVIEPGKEPEPVTIRCTEPI